VKRIYIVFLSIIAVLATDVYAENSEKKPETFTVNEPTTSILKEPATFILPTIVITPSRMDTTTLKVPGPVSVIGKEEMSISNAQTIPDALRELPGVIVRDDVGNGKTASVDIRGFGEASRMNVLVLIDGRRVNNIDLSGTDWSQIPLDQVSKIEVSRSAGSVLYGDNAVGGVINIITKKGSGPLKINASSLYGSYDREVLKGDASGSLDKLSYNINSSYSNNNGYRENSKLETEDIASRLSYELNDYISLSADAGYHEDWYGMPGALLVSDLASLSRRNTKYPLDKANTADYYAKTGMDAKLKVFGYDVGKLLTDVSFRNRDSDALTFNNLYETDLNTTMWSFNPRYILNVEFWEHFKNDLIFGLDYFNADMDISNGMVAGEKEDIAITKKTTGVYSLDEFTLFELFAVQLGYRYDWARYRFLQIHSSLGPVQNDQIRHLQEGVLSSAISYYMTDKTNIYASYTQSYRLPATDEFYASLPWGTGLNTELQPQSADNYEAGIKQYFGDILYVSGDVFLINMKNEIYFDPFTFTNSNYDKTRRYGLEFEAKVSPFKKLALFSNYTYTMPKFNGGAFDDNEIPLVPKQAFGFGGSYEIINGLKLSTVSNFVGSRRKMSDLFNRAPKAKPYFTTDAKISYIIKSFEIAGGVNNIFDEKYAEVEGYTSFNQEYLYPSPERNYFISACYRF